ncbi:MAG: ATP-binding protein [Hyphomonadaceae bacterium]
MWNPLRTLAGQLIVVTIAAILVSHAAAFVLFANERGRVLRRVAAQSVAERVVYVAQRLRAAPTQDRPAMAAAVRDFGIRYNVTAEPSVRGAHGAAAAQIANLVSDGLGGADVRAATRIVVAPTPRAWRMLHRAPGFGEDGAAPSAPGADGPAIARDDGPPRDWQRPPRRFEEFARTRQTKFPETEITLAIPLGPGSWLTARARLPAPRPLPLNIFFAGLASIAIVGVGAVLIARQIGRPLSALAAAADRLGTGETNVSLEARGPDDVRRASTAFNAMAARLGRQMARQRQMLWALSHDLRTPITALRLRAELVEDDALKQRLLSPLAEMETLTEHALILARAGASQEARENVDVAEIARTLCGELAELGVAIRAEAPSAVTITCRPNEIARAMRNLAENASKYGGGGILRVTRAANGGALIEALDEGPGLSPEELQRVTTPFYRADPARSGDGGAGLGLAIVQAIADGHGGRLELENRAPRGLAARLLLPA